MLTLKPETWRNCRIEHWASLTSMDQKVDALRPWLVQRKQAYGLLFCASLWLAGCSPAIEPAEEPIRPVKTYQVSAGLSAETLVQTGEIRPAEETSLGFRIDGRVMKRVVDVGAVVKRGDLIALLDPRDSEHQLAAANAQRDSALATERLALSTLKRLTQLAPGGAVSQAQLEQAQSEHAASVSARESADANVKSANDRLSFTRLTASNDGVISVVTANPGQVVSAGQEIVRLAALQGRDAVFDVAEALVNSQLEQPQVKVSLLSDPSITATGHIRDISPVADPVTRTIRVRVTLHDPAPAFGFGATVQGSIERTSSAVMQVPASAITRQDKAPAVYVVDAKTKTLLLKPVEIERFTDEFIYISKGISAGDLVVTAGVSKLRPGLAVKLTTEPTP